MFRNTYEAIPIMNELYNCKTTLERIEVFNRYETSNSRLFLFDETNSNFSIECSNKEFGSYILNGVADYNKTWIIDKETINKFSTELKVVKVAMWDINFFRNVHDLHFWKKATDKDNLVDLLYYLKKCNFISSAELVFYETISKEYTNDKLREGLESYIYFKNHNIKDFLKRDVFLYSNETNNLFNEVTSKMDNDNNILLYKFIVCLIVKAILLKFDKKLSIKKKVEALKNYSLYTLNIFLEYELILLFLFLNNDKNANDVFSKLQPNASDIVNKIYNCAWDIFHIRSLESYLAKQNTADPGYVYLPYFVSNDKGVSKALKINPIEFSLLSNGKLWSKRKFSQDKFFSEEEKRDYILTSPQRGRNVNNVNIDFELKKLLGQLN